MIFACGEMRPPTRMAISVSISRAAWMAYVKQVLGMLIEHGQRESTRSRCARRDATPVQLAAGQPQQLAVRQQATSWVVLLLLINALGFGCTPLHGIDICNPRFASGGAPPKPKQKGKDRREGYYGCLPSNLTCCGSWPAKVSAILSAHSVPFDCSAPLACLPPSFASS